MSHNGNQCLLCGLPYLSNYFSYISECTCGSASVAVPTTNADIDPAAHFLACREALGIDCHRLHLAGHNMNTNPDCNTIVQRAITLHTTAVLASAFILGAAVMLTCNGCQPPRPSDLACSRRFSDGSSACEAPIGAISLNGKYCDATPGQYLCLEVTGDDKHKAYHWSASDCEESGLLSGALEFNPFSNRNQTPLCFPETVTDGMPDLYSASVDPAPGGFTFYIDGQKPYTLVKVAGY